MESYSLDANTLREQLDNRGNARIALETITIIAQFIVGVAGNFLVLLVVNKKKEDGKVIHLFIGSLAISDILLMLSYNFLSSGAIALGKWPFPELICQLQGFCILASSCASMLLMAITAINRYFRVVRTSYYGLLFTPKRTILLICGAWAMASIVPIQYLASGERYLFHPGKCICFQNDSLKPSTFVVYAIVFLPMCVITFCYYNIFKTIRKHQVSMQQNINDTTTGPNIQDIKVTRVLFLTVVGYITCWTPILIIDIVEFIRGPYSLPREVYVLYSFLGGLSSAINPFIYGAMNPIFKEQYKKILRPRCTGRIVEGEHAHVTSRKPCPVPHNKVGNRGSERKRSKGGDDVSIELQGAAKPPGQNWEPQF